MTTQSECHFKHHPDDWFVTSEQYHRVTYGVQPLIAELVKWALQATQILPPDSSSSSVLDDACGTGAVTVEVKKLFPEIPVLAIDSSAGMLEVFNRNATVNGFQNVKTRLLDGGNLADIPSNSITHAFACTFIDLAHNASLCIQELYRVMTPNGVLAMNTWVDSYRLSIAGPWVKICQKLDPGYKAPLIMNPNWSTPHQIKENLLKAGFKNVQTKQMNTHYRWESSEKMTNWIFDGGNPMVKRWHEAVTDECGGHLENFRELFHQEVVKEYRNEGGHLLLDESANLTIARK